MRIFEKARKVLAVLSLGLLVSSLIPLGSPVVHAAPTDVALGVNVATQATVGSELPLTLTFTNTTQTDFPVTAVNVNAMNQEYQNGVKVISDDMTITPVSIDRNLDIADTGFSLDDMNSTGVSKIASGQTYVETVNVNFKTSKLYDFEASIVDVNPDNPNAGDAISQTVPFEIAVNPVNNIQPIITVQSVLTDTANMLPITGTINDPTATISTLVYNGGSAFFSYPGVNNGDGTWSAAVTDALPLGTYTIQANATIGLNNSSAIGSYVVMANVPIAPTATVSYAPASLTNQNVVATITPSEPIIGELTHTFSSNGSYTFNFTDVVGTPGSVTASVNWIDKTKPVIAAHSNIVVVATSPAGAVVNYTAPLATDNVDATASAVCAPVSGSTFKIGTTAVTCNKTDAAGNLATPTKFYVIVNGPGPALDGFTIKPNNGVSTSSTPYLWTHTTDFMADIADCQYQYKTDLVSWSGWQEGVYVPDQNNGVDVIGAGECLSPAIDTAGATQFSGQVRVTDALGAYTDSEVQTLQVVNVTPTISVKDVLTNNQPLPTITGDVDDATAAVYVDIHNADSSVQYVYDGINNGDGTWSAKVLDAIPEGSYILDAFADNNVNTGIASGSYVVDTTAPVITINGQSPINIRVGTSYVDAGATALDNLDGNISNMIQTVNNVDSFHVGHYTVTYNVKDAAGNSAETKTREVNVVARDITVTASDASKVYGTVDPALVYSYDASILMEGDHFTGTLVRDAGENVGVYPIHKGSLALNSNYAITFVPAELTITRAQGITIVADSVSREFGTTNPIFSGQVSGILSSDSDNIKVTYSTLADVNSPVGKYDIVPAITGTALLNYNSPVLTNGVLTIVEATTKPTTGEGGNGGIATSVSPISSDQSGDLSGGFEGLGSAIADNSASSTTKGEVKSSVKSDNGSDKENNDQSKQVPYFGIGVLILLLLFGLYLLYQARPDWFAWMLFWQKKPSVKPTKK